MGWRFTVGVNPVTLTHLRVLAGTTTTVTLRVWRVKYQALVAIAAVSAVADSWVDAPLSPPIVLTPGEDYIITGRPSGLVNMKYANFNNVTVTAGVTKVGTPQINADGYPSGTVSGLYGIPDAQFFTGGTPDPTTYLIEVGPTTFGQDSVDQVGWRFEVGNAPLTAKGLRVNIPGGAVEETVRLWRVGGGALLASVAITPGATAYWVEAPITPVTLAANTQYVVSTRRTNGTSRVWHGNTRTNLTFDSRVAAQAGHRASGDAYPPAVSGSEIYGLCDVVLSN